MATRRRTTVAMIFRPTTQYGLGERAGEPFRNHLFRYFGAVVAVVAIFLVRLWLIPLTGTGAPFVLFFAVALAISLFVGTGPGLVAVAVSLPLAAYMFVVRAGYPLDQASFL